MRLPLLLALSWLALKMLIFFTSIVENTLDLGIMLNLLFLVVLVYTGVKKGAETGRDTFHLLRAGMRPAAIYVLLVTIAIFCYYQFLDTTFFQDKLEQVISQTHAGIESAGGWDAFKKQEGLGRSFTQEAFMTEQKEGMQRMLFSPLPQASYSLLALTMTGFFYSLVMALIFKGMERYFK